MLVTQQPVFRRFWHAVVPLSALAPGQPVPFTLLGPLRATGRGRMGNADFLFTYGLPPEQAGPFLGLPAYRLLPPES